MSFIKNAAAFGKLVGICAGYEGRYNPAHQNLSISTLRMLAEKANNANRSVGQANQLRITAAGQRRNAFEELRVLVKSLRGEISNLSIDEATRGMLNDALNGMAGFRKDSGVKTISADGVPIVNPGKHSSGNDYSTRLAAFELLISTLSGTAVYMPSSESASISSLQKRMKNLNDLMEQVNKAKAALDDARSYRKKVFFQSGGVLDTTRSVKNVFKSIFGNPSDELTGIRSIRFI